MEIPEISNILQNDIISLLYNDIDTSNFKNIILIHDEVQDYNIFIQSANLDSYPIIYNSSSCKDDLKNLLKNKFSNIERISLVFHNEGIDQLKEFIDNEPLFTNNDLNETPHKYSNNLQFIIDLVKDFNIKNLDYLACNTFQYDYWNKYYNIIYRETNVIIGASNNLTGNIKYGGDWVLESTNEDIKNIYFTDNIDEYHYTLSTNISTSTTINQSNIDGYTWPVTIDNGSQSTPVVITFGENLTITGTTSYYFIIGSEYIEIDGNNKVVTISGIPSYPGLLRNGTSSGTSANGYTNISIYNLGVVTSSTTTLVNNGGWICHSYFGKAITSGNITVTNCYSTGAISSAGGGISGFNTGNSSTGGTITVTKCYSTGNITASNGGCILGANTGSFLNGGTINITNCYSIGAIATNGGGILGNNTGISLGNGTIKVENCYSSGNITNPGGGILGNNTGSSSTGGTITVTNCYSSGNIGSSGANGGGGIVGNNTRSSSGIATVTVTNCYTIGSIGSSAGGIYGNNNNGGTSSYCIYVGGSTLDVTPNPTQVAGTWVDNNATSTIAKNTTTLIIPSNWIDYSTSGSVPWLLSAFNDTIYDPNTQTLIYGTPGTSNAGLFIGYNYLIFLTNPTTTAITINASTGVLTFPDTLSVGTYTISVLVGIITSTVYYAYNSNIYTLTVNKENQTITFNSLSDKVYGDSPFNLTASSTSGLTITYTSSDTSVATISGNTVTIVGAGNSTITASQSGNDYYNAATNVPQNLTVNKASQTITFDSLSDKVYGDQPFNLLASSTSGLTITYTSSDPSVATISGITVTIVGVGTSIITASQPGNNNYNAATNVPQNLTVNKASQTITFDTLSSKIFGDPPFNLTAVNTSNLIISYISSNIKVAVISDSTVIIVGVGATLITASQSGNSNYNSAANVYQNLIVNYGGYNIQLNSPQLAYNENIKKYYLNVIKKNNLNSKKIEVYNKSSYSRIFYPDESISYP